MESNKNQWLILVTILAVLIFSMGCTFRESVTGDAVFDDETGEWVEVDTTETDEEMTEVTVEEPEVKIVAMEASRIRKEYELSRFLDCGDYVRRNNEEGNEGSYVDVYGCFNSAFKSCKPAKAFVDVQTPEGARIVSFLSTANCMVTNHIKGNDPFGYSDENMETCDEINPDLALQYACIGYDI